MVNDITEQVLRGEWENPKYVAEVKAWLDTPLDLKTERRVFIIAKARLLFMHIDREFHSGVVSSYIALTDDPVDMTQLPAFLGLKEIQIYTTQPSLYTADGWQLCRVIMTKASGFPETPPPWVDFNAILTSEEMSTFLEFMHVQGQSEVMRLLAEGHASIHMYRDGNMRGCIVTDDSANTAGLLATIAPDLETLDILLDAFDYLAGQRGQGTISAALSNPLLGVAAERQYQTVLTTVILTDHLLKE